MMFGKRKRSNLERVLEIERVRVDMLREKLAGANQDADAAVADLALITAERNQARESFDRLMSAIATFHEAAADITYDAAELGEPG